jgi:hypothetical protein
MTISNEAANVANRIIAGVMSSDQSANGRQTALVLYMYDNEVSYSLDEVSKYFTVKGADRAKLIEGALIALSDDYASAVELRDTITAKKKADKESFAAKEALQLEGTVSKIRAANMLFIRALTGVFHLRTVDATKVKSATAIGSIQYIGKDKDGDAVKTVLSGNALVRLGDKDISEAFGAKTKKAASVANPVKGGIAPIADVVANRVGMQIANGVGIEDMSDDEEAALEKLLKTLLKAKFADDKGQLDRATLTDYLETEFPKAAAKKSAA